MEINLDALCRAQYGRACGACEDEEVYRVLLDLTQRMIHERRERSYAQRRGKKKLYYLCAEFLLGRMLRNHLINLGVYDTVCAQLQAAGKDLACIEELECEPSLGNGGLGRLAACFLDSIAALGLGADSAIGIDIDPKAEDIARENAAYNGFAAPQFTALTGNVTEDKELMQQLASQEYDLVLVNIVADVIIGLSPVLPNFLTKNSTLICSGILDVRLEEVCAALKKAGLTITAIKEKEDWRSVTARKE